MRLRRFTVDGFAQLAHVEVEFRDEAPNVIFGLNEAGKSHLMQAFCGMFFPVDHPDLLVPWNGDPTMRGTLEFVDAVGRLVHLERDFTSAAVTVNVAGETPWSSKVKGSTPDALRFAEYLKSWLGFRDQGLFAATTFVRQADVIVHDGANDGRGLATQVKELITGTQETSYDRVLKDLEKELDGLRRRPSAHKNREIEIKRAELEEARIRYQQAVSNHDRYSILDFEVGQLEHDSTKARSEFEAVAQRVRDAATLVERESELQRLNAEFQKLDGNRRKLADLELKLATACERCDALARFTPVDDARLTDVQRDLDEAQREVARLADAGIPNLVEISQRDAAAQAAESDLNQLPPWPAGLPIELIREANREASAPSRPPFAPPGGPAIHWLIALATAIVGVGLGLIVHPLFFVLVVGVVVYVAVSYRRSGSRQTIDARPAPPAAQEKLSGLLARVGASTVQDAEHRWQTRQNAVEAVAESTEALRDALGACGVATVAQAADRDSQYRRANEARNRAQSARDSLLRDLDVASIKEARVRLADLRQAQQERGGLETAMSALGDKDDLEAEWKRVGVECSQRQFDVDGLLNRDPSMRSLSTPEARAEYVAQLMRTRDALQQDIDALENKGTEARRNRADLGSANLEDIPVLFSQIAERELEISRLERKARALQIAIDELNAAVSHFRDHCLGEVMVDTSEFLQTVTDGRYTSVEVESDTLVPTVLTPDRRIAAPQLSRGVQDQLYFALRVALARAITRGRTLPLVLDDPFVNFDPVRRERVLHLLRGLVDRTQVILFTCDPWYGECIEPVLVLRPIEQPIASTAIIDVA